jgi:hypothetical protein
LISASRNDAVKAVVVDDDEEDDDDDDDDDIEEIESHVEVQSFLSSLKVSTLRSILLNF